MSVLLIRHASAGDRDEWTGDDRRRPLDRRGRKQARRLVDLLASYPVERIVSSPADRCVQTVEPLADARGLTIEVREEVWEDVQRTEGAPLVRSLAASDVAVSCHGGLSDALIGEGQKKGEAIVLELQDDRLAVAERLRA
jgi:phosphohistidine phosphatase SixA